MAKRRLSPYQPNRRSRDWLKIKLRREQEIVVVGWLPGQGTHKDLGSLIVAVNDEWRPAACRAGGQRDQCPHAQGAWTAMEPIRRGRSAGQDASAAAGALGRAADRDPRRVHRLDARRAAAPGGLQGIELDRDPAKVVREEAVPAARVAKRAPSANRRPSKRQAPADGPAHPPAKSVSTSKRHGRRPRWTSRPPAAPS